ncbi:endo-1,4-beta-xylanase [Flavobacterium sp. FZUC8N2.13]|uniref:Beta-xylanase n=1 Tax=Flavobacterium zubiriense TaxID=3138075 RepID=A0ABV4TFH0_9FLAO
MKKISSYLFLVLLILNSCSQDEDTQLVRNTTNPTTPTTANSLKEAYKQYFLLGTALNRGQIQETSAKATTLIAREFNALTAENDMKSAYMQPVKNSFNFTESDKIMAFAQKHNMYVVGHTLIWHSQLPNWLSAITDAVEMNKAIENHVTTIVKKYKGKIGSWDVVNEAVEDNGSLRKSVFFNVLGEDYIAKSFQLAAEADPSAELYYNDYSMTNPTKRAGVIRMVKKIQEQNIKIDGIGMQGHWHIDSPSIADIESSIIAYANLGVKVAITELDVSVLPSPWGQQGADINQNFENNPTMNPYPNVLPDAMQIKLAQRYYNIFKLFLKHKDKISRVTFWGVNDAQSWLNNFPIQGRTDYPLLFDRDFEPKKAYQAVIDVAKEK